MVPRHKNPTRKERTAVAPYNFIPAPDPVITLPLDSVLDVDRGQYHAGRWTGWMDVKLTTQSPVYVRGPLKPADHEKMERQEKDRNDATPHLDKIRNRPDFFHTGDPNDPVIPGSSLRGMLRTIVEILGHGKLKPVTNTPLVYRAVGDTSSHGEAYRQLFFVEEPDRKHYYIPLFTAGYIRKHKERWYIQPAEPKNGTTYARINHKRIPKGQLQRWHDCRNANEIYIKISDLNFQPVKEGFLHIKYAKVIEAESGNLGNGWMKGILARSGPMFSKKTEAVIFPPPEKDEPGKWIAIPDGSDETDPRDLVTAYYDQITPEQEKLLGPEGVLREYQPVFYRMDGDKLLFFFGHTQMFRMPYGRSPQGFLTPPHNDGARIDFAEALFGRVRRDAKGGRVFVTDACLISTQDKNKLWLEGNPVVIPKVLNGPKPTTFQHYLTQSNPDVPQGKGLHTYNASPQQTTLRGYKMYWHKGKEVKRQDIAEAEKAIDRQKDKVHTQIKPVREGVSFQFRIHFENLLPAELGLLWWAVALPVKGSQDYCHKLGMGKPLGLGAVKLSPELHLIDLSPNCRYSQLFAGDSNPIGWEVGETSPDLLEAAKREAVAQFENFILRRSKLPEATLEQTERVQMLLKMLVWPGPDPKNTRYMEIEQEDPLAKRGKRNEYKDRPVLPDPLHV